MVLESEDLINCTHAVVGSVLNCTGASDHHDDHGAADVCGYCSIIGVLLALVGSVSINTGNNLQSLGMHRLEMAELERMQKEGATDEEMTQIQVTSCKMLMKSKMWFIGTVIFVVGSCMNFVSFGFAPSVVVASIEAIQFVSNIMFGKFLLKDNISTRMYVGTVMIVVAVIMIVLVVELAAAEMAASGGHDAWTLESLKNNYRDNVTFLVYFGCMCVLASVLYPANATCRKKNLKRLAENPNAPPIWMNAAEPISYAVFSAIFGTQAVVQAKAMAICIELNAFDDWFFYVTVVLWLSFVLIWLYRMNGALAKFNPLFIIPLLHCNFIFGAIVSGGIFFKEFDALTTWYQWLAFLIGLGLMLTGLYLVRPAATSSVAPEVEEAAAPVISEKTETEKKQTDDVGSEPDPNEAEKFVPKPSAGVEPQSKEEKAQLKPATGESDRSDPLPDINAHKLKVTPKSPNGDSRNRRPSLGDLVSMPALITDSNLQNRKNASVRRASDPDLEAPPAHAS